MGNVKEDSDGDDWNPLVRIERSIKSIYCAFEKYLNCPVDGPNFCETNPLPYREPGMISDPTCKEYDVKLRDFVKKYRDQYDESVCPDKEHFHCLLHSLPTNPDHYHCVSHNFKSEGDYDETAKRHQKETKGRQTSGTSAEKEPKPRLCHLCCSPREKPNEKSEAKNNTSLPAVYKNKLSSPRSKIGNVCMSDSDENDAFTTPTSNCNLQEKPKKCFPCHEKNKNKMAADTESFEFDCSADEKCRKKHRPHSCTMRCNPRDLMIPTIRQKSPVTAGCDKEVDCDETPQTPVNSGCQCGCQVTSRSCKMESCETGQKCNRPDDDSCNCTHESNSKWSTMNQCWPRYTPPQVMCHCKVHRQRQPPSDCCNLCGKGFKQSGCSPKMKVPECYDACDSLQKNPLIFSRFERSETLTNGSPTRFEGDEEAEKFGRNDLVFARYEREEPQSQNSLMFARYEKAEPANNCAETPCGEKTFTRYTKDDCTNDAEIPESGNEYDTSSEEDCAEKCPKPTSVCQVKTCKEDCQQRRSVCQVKTCKEDCQYRPACKQARRGKFVCCCKRIDDRKIKCICQWCESPQKPKCNTAKPCDTRKCKKTDCQKPCKPDPKPDPCCQCPRQCCSSAIKTCTAKPCYDKCCNECCNKIQDNQFEDCNPKTCRDNPCKDCNQKTCRDNPFKDCDQNICRANPFKDCNQKTCRDNPFKDCNTKTCRDNPFKDCYTKTCPKPCIDFYEVPVYPTNSTCCRNKVCSCPEVSDCKVEECERPCPTSTCDTSQLIYLDYPEDDDESCCSSFLWEHYAPILDLLQSGKHCEITSDIVLVLGTDEYQAHKIVLVTYSSYLREQILKNSMLDRLDITCLNISKEGLEAVLEWMYTAEVTLDSDNIGHVWAAAKCLGIGMLSDYCRRYIRRLVRRDGKKGLCEMIGEHRLPDGKVFFSEDCKQECNKKVDCTVPENDEDWYCQLARFPLSAGKTSTAKKFRSKQSKEDPNDFRYPLHRFLEWTPEKIIRFLSRAGRNSELCEEKVFAMATGWLRHRWPDRKCYIPKVMACVRFRRLPSAEVKKAFGDPDNKVLWENKQFVSAVLLGYITRCAPKLIRTKIANVNKCHK